MGNKDIMNGETIDLNAENNEENLDLTDYTAKISDDLFDHKPQITIDSFIGEGVFGRVYKAKSSYYTDDGEVNDIALKILNPQNLKGNDEIGIKDMKNRFNRECILQDWMSQKIPDKIVNVYDYGEFREHRFIAMELMKGNSLRDIASNYKDYKLKDRIRIMIDVAKILIDVHDLGFVHRDIKPENILFSRYTQIKKQGDDNYRFEGDRKIKLTDFGLIRWRKNYLDPEDNKIIGTPNYMAPEQVNNPKKVDKRTDIFSFGVVFYEMLNDEYPREASNKGSTDDFDYDIMKMIVESEPKPIKEKNSMVNDHLNDILMRCMEKGQDKRYQDMGEVLTSLRKYYYSVFEE